MHLRCACKTAALGCLQALLAIRRAYGCIQVLLAIKQPLAAFKLCFLYSSLWLPLRVAGFLQAVLVIQQPLAAFKLCLLYSSLWLTSSSACYTAAFACLQTLLAIQQPLAQAAFKLCLLYSSQYLLSILWPFQAFLVIRLVIAPSFICYTAAFGFLQALQTAAFGCFQALLAIQQPLTVFKLCLFNRLPLSFTQYTVGVWLLSRFAGCLHPVLVMPLAAFKLYLVYSSLWLCFVCHTAVFGCLAIQQPLAHAHACTRTHTHTHTHV